MGPGEIRLPLARRTPPGPAFPSRGQPMLPADRLAHDLHRLSRSAADLAEVLGSGPDVPASAVLAAAVRVGGLRRALDALGDRLAGQADAGDEAPVRALFSPAE